MGTLQDISLKLMRPVKELVAWDFPLGQILEEYFALLNRPGNVNFGEAALVLQNSVDVYGRRIEQLSDDALTMCQSFSHNDQNEEQKTKSHGKKMKIKGVDFKDFELVDLSEKIGKNIDMKSEHCSEKSVKLLSKRFTQLEPSAVNTGDPIELFDVNGEVIGKKYDFRCNQYLNFDGILVDNPSPDEFTNYNAAHAVTPLLRAEINPGRARSSGYCSNTSYHGTSSNCSGTVDENNFEIETDLAGNLENSSLNQSAQSELLVCSQSQGEENGVFVGNVTTKSDVNASNNSLHNETCASDSSNEDVGMDSGYMSALDVSCAQSIRSTEIQVPLSENCQDEDVWKPIPFTENSVDVTLSKKRFLLPIRIGSSTFLKSRKRKSVFLDVQDNPITKFLMKESAAQKNEPVNWALKMAALKPAKPDDFEKFKKSFCKIMTAPGHPDFYYEALKTITMSMPEEVAFLNSHITPNSKTKCTDLHHENETKSIDFETAAMERDIDLRLPSRWPTPHPDLNTQDSCDFSDLSNSLDLSATSFTDRQSVFNKYHRLINDKMEEIFNDNTDRTEIEKTVAKWHKLLQPKLEETEKRNVFMIKDYAKKIVDILKQTDDRQLGFDKIVDGQPSPEVARYFLAVLQLASTYNVDLNYNVNSGDGVKLQLLNESNDEMNYHTFNNVAK